MAQQKIREELIEMVQKLIDATLPEEDLIVFSRRWKRMSLIVAQELDLPYQSSVDRRRGRGQGTVLPAG